VEVPPAYDLAVVNLAHYRNSAIYEHTLYLTAMPTPGCTGVSDEGEKKALEAMGPGALWLLTSPNAKAFMLEFQGHGAEAIRQAMLDKLNHMASLGARMIAEKKRAAESAEKARLDSQDETSLATEIVRTVEDALTATLRTMADWVAANPEEVEVTFNREFVETRLTAQETLQLASAWQMGAFSEDALWWNYQRGGRVPANRTLEEDRELREEEPEVTRFKPGAGPDEGEEEDEGDEGEE